MEIKDAVGEEIKEVTAYKTPDGKLYLEKDEALRAYLGSKSWVPFLAGLLFVALAIVLVAFAYKNWSSRPKTAAAEVYSRMRLMEDSAEGSAVSQIDHLADIGFMMRKSVLSIEADIPNPRLQVGTIVASRS